MRDLMVTGLRKQNVKVQKQAIKNNYFLLLTSGQSGLGDRLSLLKSAILCGHSQQCYRGLKLNLLMLRIKANRATEFQTFFFFGQHARPRPQQFPLEGNTVLNSDTPTFLIGTLPVSSKVQKAPQQAKRNKTTGPTTLQTVNSTQEDE